jgi:DNA-binding beta-propeller fold protein YncE
MMERSRRLILSLAIAASSANAQSFTGTSAADSANVARAAWTRAADALQHADSSTARREITRAAQSWPSQPAYLWGSAVFASLAHDSVGTFDALGRYASLGLGRDLRAETRFSWLRESATFATLAAAHDVNSAPRAASRVVATLPDSTFWPEGVDFDARTKRFYVASVAHRTIAEIRDDGTTRELITRDRADLSAVLGVRVDATHGVLWATTSPVRPSPTFASGDTISAELLRVRISDGAIERRWRLKPAELGHTLGDLAVAANGDVFFTDSNEPVLYRLKNGADSLDALRSPLFRSLQGIAPLPGGDVAYVADYSHGLLRVDLRTNAVTRLDDAPQSTSLGCDGIAWDRGAIVAVQNGVSPARVTRFVLDASGRRIVRADVLDRNSAVADEPTIGTIAGGSFVYVANSQWEKHDGVGGRVLTRPLTPPVLLAVPLPAMAK